MNDFQHNFEIVAKILSDSTGTAVKDIKPESELLNDLGVNSLELADLVLQCEEKFDISLEDSVMSSFITVNDLVAYITQL